jgi:glycosyltransferase involved in cell wall biosynthesis
MRIRIVSPGGNTFPVDLTQGMGGIMKSQLEIARALTSKGHRVQLLCFNPGNAPSKTMGDFGELLRIKKWTWLRGRKKDFSYLAPLFLKILVEGGCDILHANNDPYLLYLPRAKKRVLQLHLMLGGRPPEAYSRVLKKADAVICCSCFVRQELLSFTDYPEDRIFVVYNGVAMEEFDGVDDGEIRDKLGIQEDEIVLLYAGQIEKRKGLNFLVEAFRRVSDKYPHTHLVIAGSSDIWQPTPETQLYEEEIRKKCRRLNVHFLGKLSQREIPKVYKSADIFVLPSLSEGFPLSVLEVMASGKPVVATEVGGVPEVVKDGMNGYLVQPGSVSKLADTISKLIENERLRLRMGHKGRKIVKDYTWEKAANEINQIYRKLLE